MDFLNLLKHCYRLTRASFHKVWMYVSYRYQHVTVSLHYLPKRLRWTVSCNKNACYSNIKWTFTDLLPCYCYTIKTNSRTIRSRLSQPTSAGKGGDMSELQAHHCMTLQLWTWLLCSVSFIQAKKLSLQESNQLIGIKIPTSGFSRNILFLIPIPRRGTIARFASPALRAPMRSLTILYQVA